MPELPEVETIKRTLQRLVIGKTIQDVTILWGNIIKQPADGMEFKIKCQGQTIHDIDRRGKFLKFILDEDVLVSHLRMEGRYMLQQSNEPYEKHTHVIFSFTDNTELRYMDVRKFGTMHLLPKGEEEQREPLVKLGVEPFSNEFTPDVLQKAFQRTNRSIKAVLLDQSIVVGLGNIYVDEALFRAQIHPTQKANKLPEKSLETLHAEIIETLKEAVDKGGSTVRSYVNSQGDMGMFQLNHFVYGKKGEPCRKCGTEIEKTVVAQRGTHYCPKCQK
ncbi:DNA-formamidopyrimidine glycosylase [Pueribacillus sp. YX66]|uniref:DNA-formamidopyrimidine glycosylase n=1 Tax=Pueribacillus sp. YX66 TaxID=3229242 RepID=UPI00358D7EDD